MNQPGDGMAEIGKSIVDPLVAPAAKVGAITGSGVASYLIAGYTINEWTLILAFIGAVIGLIYGLMCVVAITPKFVRSIKWFFQPDRRRPDYLCDDAGTPRRRFDDQKE